MLGGFQNKIKHMLPTAGSIKHFATSYVLALAAAIAAVGLAYQYADVDPATGKRDLKGSWKSWAYGLGSVALVSFILGSLKMTPKAIKDIATDRFAQSVLTLTAGLILVFDTVLEPVIRANPDGYVAKVFFAPGAVIDKVGNAAAKAELGYAGVPQGGGAPASNGGISTTPAAVNTQPVTGANTPNQADPLSSIANAINQIGSQIEMATQPVGGSVPGGTAGTGYGGWATSLQGMSGAGDGVFGQLVRQSPM